MFHFSKHLEIDMFKDLAYLIYYTFSTKKRLDFHRHWSYSSVWRKDTYSIMELHPKIYELLYTINVELKNIFFECEQYWMNNLSIKFSECLTGKLIQAHTIIAYSIQFKVFFIICWQLNEQLVYYEKCMFLCQIIIGKLWKQYFEKFWRFI